MGSEMLPTLVQTYRTFISEGGKIGNKESMGQTHTSIGQLPSNKVAYVSFDAIHGWDWPHNLIRIDNILSPNVYANIDQTTADSSAVNRDRTYTGTMDASVIEEIENYIRRRRTTGNYSANIQKWVEWVTGANSDGAMNFNNLRQRIQNLALFSQDYVCIYAPLDLAEPYTCLVLNQDQSVDCPFVHDFLSHYLKRKFSDARVANLDVNEALRHQVRFTDKLEKDPEAKASTEKRPGSPTGSTPKLLKIDDDGGLGSISISDNKGDGESS